MGTRSERGPRARGRDKLLPDLAPRERKGPARGGGSKEGSKTRRGPPQSHCPLLFLGAALPTKGRSTGVKALQFQLLKNHVALVGAGVEAPSLPKGEGRTLVPNPEPGNCEARQAEATRGSRAPGFPLRHLSLLSYQEGRSGLRCLSCLPCGSSRWKEQRRARSASRGHSLTGPHPGPGWLQWPWPPPSPITALWLRIPSPASLPSFHRA